MPGEEEDLQPADGEHRHLFARAGVLGEHLGVADERDLRRLQRLLVDRRGRHAGDVTGHREIDRGADRGIGGLSAKRLHLAGLKHVGIGGVLVHHVDHAGAVGQRLRSGDAVELTPTRETAHRQRAIEHAASLIRKPREHSRTGESSAAHRDLGPMPAGSPMVTARTGRVSVASLPSPDAL